MYDRTAMKPILDPGGHKFLGDERQFWGDSYAIPA
jgi:hypothetical protein